MGGYVDDVNLSLSSPSVAHGGAARLDSSNWTVNFSGHTPSTAPQAVATIVQGVPWWAWAAASIALVLYAKRKR